MVSRIDIELPVGIEGVTVDWLNRVLAGHPDFANRPVAAFSAVPLGEGVGQMSVLAILELTVTGETAPRRVVIKLKAPHPAMDVVAHNYHMYEREIRFYQTLGRRVPIRVPKIYFAEFDAEQDSCAVIMEHFDGWRSPDQIDGANAADMGAAVDRLACLSAAFWDGAGLTGLDWLPDTDSEYMRGGIQDYQNCVPEFLRRMQHVLPDGGAAAVRQIAERMPELFAHMGLGHQVLTHYDFRVENMFFRAGEMALVDWQLVMRLRVGWDFAYLLGTNMRIEDRRDQFDELVDRYLAGLAGNGVDDYRRAEFMADLRCAAMAMTQISVIGGSNFDTSNGRNVALFEAIAARSFALIMDLDCLDALDQLDSAG